jgi:hypothetical protein
MGQKRFIKFLFWIGVAGFGIVSVTLHHVPAGIGTQRILWVLLGVFLALYAVAIVGWALLFLRRPVFSRDEAAIPRKYYFLLMAFLALFGIGILF